MKTTLLIAFIIGFTFSVINAQAHFCEEHLFASINEIKQDTIETDSASIEKREENEVNRFSFQEEWTIGPNPTYGTVNIYGDLENIKSIELFSITGELLEFYDEYNQRSSIDLSPYQNGIYLVRILSRYNELKTYKVIKR